MAGTETRAQIVDAADRLFYEHGYEHTSFAAIAEAVQISRGNFYYHFKSKDQILDAVIAARLERTRGMLDCWTAGESNPAGRIRRFVEIVVTNRADIQDHGCPVGTLTSELAKLDHPALGEAKGLFVLFRSWLGEQFGALGQYDRADELAMHVLAFSQGVATLAQAFRDEDFIRREVERMLAWLTTVTPVDSATEGDDCSGTQATP
ncbi:TetR/AcrR family transcriptional regulator [Kitasatospora sp. NPDC058965]|uniref:TetR/AcrR family transcriptional regulator n=1 Tax=Kitasatospora sp. NPDC058965 TaxID=3346682 RepID=UPI00368A96FF